MRSVRSHLFYALIVLVTIVLGAAFLPSFLMGRRVGQAIVRIWSTVFVWLLRSVVGLRHELRGMDRLPDGGCLIAAKHQSAWETLVPLSFLPRAAYILKRELLGIPVIGWYIRGAAMIPIDRSAGASAMRAMLRAAGEAYNQGRPVVIFPEGTRTPPGRKGRYHPGVAGLYEALGAPIYPVAVNSGLYWGSGLGSLRPGTVVMEVLEPLPPGLGRREMLERLKSVIQPATERLEREAGFHAPEAEGETGEDRRPA